MAIPANILRLLSGRHVSAISVGFGGAMGAVARYAVSTAVQNNIVSILICNIIGSFIVGFAAELQTRINPHVKNMVSAGFCGGLSVFSGFAKDSELLAANQDLPMLALNVFSNFTLCILAVFSAAKVADLIKIKRSRK